MNFGVFAGRAATPAEIDRLAEWLLDEVGEVSIVSEERHEIDTHGEAVIHQVRIEVEPGDKKSRQRRSSRGHGTGRGSASRSATPRSQTTCDLVELSASV